MIERVQKIIANAGLMSRRKADLLVSEGRVTINDRKAIVGDKADSERDVIAIDGKRIRRERKEYIIFNKPKFVICSMEKLQKGKSILSYIKIKERIYPAGRLDFDSEGLVFLTNDGELTNLIMHPRYETEKEYLVDIDTQITDEHLESLRKGIMLEDGMTWPVKISTVSGSRTSLDLIMHEGRKGQIKRMFSSLGYYVKRLLRIRIGNILLGKLESGKHRNLSEDEIEKLRILILKSGKLKPAAEKTLAEKPDAPEDKAGEKEIYAAPFGNKPNSESRSKINNDEINHNEISNNPINHNPVSNNSPNALKNSSAKKPKAAMNKILRGKNHSG
ncbi:MAG: pseudouridine synthase [Candidatus Woesearchaeota archaeon]|nr:pseudouridine synthase [Candidatus Woesearchaeota archaeon]